MSFLLSVIHEMPCRQAIQVVSPSHGALVVGDKLELTLQRRTVTHDSVTISLQLIDMQGNVILDDSLMISGGTDRATIILTVGTLPERSFLNVCSGCPDPLQVQRLHLFRSANLDNAHLTLKPVLLMTLPRSGSTYAMTVIGALQGVSFHTAYPFETSFSQYELAQFIRNATPFRSELLTVELDPSYRSNLSYINPFYPRFNDLNPWFARYYIPSKWQNVCSSISGFYEKIARDDKCIAFCEKSLIEYKYLANYMALFPSAVLIFIARDPRDIIASILAFDKKRGYSGFDAEGRSTAQLCSLYADMGNRLAETFKRFENRSLIIKYPHVINAPEKVKHSVARFLGLTGETDNLAFSSGWETWHRTSEGQANEGWRSRLSSQQGDALLSEARAYVDTFGLEKLTEKAVE